jgi:hypothetical protein
MTAKVPGAAPEKGESLIADGSGVGPEIDRFLGLSRNDRQLPLSDDTPSGLPQAAIEKGPEPNDKKPLSHVKGGIPQRFRGI